MTDRYAANEARQREEAARADPIPSEQGGRHRYECLWCSWYATGSEAGCKKAWREHQCYGKRLEGKPDPLNESNLP